MGEMWKCENVGKFENLKIWEFENGKVWVMWQLTNASAISNSKS